MKIGIDARPYRIAVGGIGRYVQALVTHLIEIDQENEYFLYFTPEGITEFSSSAKNIHIRVTPSALGSFSEQIRWLRMVQQDHCDVMHFTTFAHPLLYHAPFVVTIHDLIPYIYPQVRRACPLLRRTMRACILHHALHQAKKIVTISHATQQDLIHYKKVNKNKMRTIYLGINSHFNKDVPSDPERLSQTYHISKPYLLFVSQWSPHKGLNELLSAFETLKKEGMPHQLVLVGKQNVRFPEFLERIHRSPYHKDIVVTGFCDDADIPLLYKQAALLAFPSHYEGFGLPPLEAMAVGTPVVASHTSCMPEILGDAAAYVDPFSPSHLAQGIRAVLDNPSLQETLRQRGWEQVKKYSWRTMAQETLALYREHAR